MISCIIIEDQIPAQNILRKYIKDSGVLDLKKVFSDALTALEYLSKNQIDLLFLDIHLPKLSGLNFLKILPQKPNVILTTAFSEYALKGYDMDVVDYLLKPFSFERFLKAILKAEQRINNLTLMSSQSKETSDSIIVKDGYDYIKISNKEILYIKSDGDYTQVYSTIKRYIISYPLKFWLEKLPDNRFFQIHRSYIVNVHKIQKVTSSNVIISNIHIPIGRVYKRKFNEFYLNSQNGINNIVNNN